MLLWSPDVPHSPVEGIKVILRLQKPFGTVQAQNFLGKVKEMWDKVKELVWLKGEQVS